MNEAENKNIQKELIAEERKLFQVERIAFFSDAVMAIALTLLVIEFHLPTPGHGEEPAVEIWETLMHLMALVFAFGVIGSLWGIHHSLFGRIITYNKRLIVLNMIFLFSIVMLPAMASYMFNPYAPNEYKSIVFSFSYFICWTTNWMLLRYAYNPAHQFLTHYHKEEDRRIVKLNGAIALISGIPAVVSLFYPEFMGVAYAAFGFVGFFAKKKKNKVAKA